MSECLNPTLHPAPHPRTRLPYRRARKLQDILAAEETAWPDWPDYDQLRLMLARRRALFADRWRGCPERLCRRHRYCVQVGLHCPRQPPPDLRPLTAAGYAAYARIRQVIDAQRATALPCHSGTRAQRADPESRGVSTCGSGFRVRASRRAPE